jgi:Tfp pilus assembly protein PilV
MFRARRAASALSSEQGSLLIEVMVGAVVLAITTFAVLNGLEGAQQTGLKNKQRTVSATLAQQDIERLRSYPITSLSNFSQTRTVDVGGVPYTVQSVTEWITDSTDPRNCTDQTGSSDYVKISSTVSSRAQATPVKEVSLLTPAAGALSDTHGTLAVKVTNRRGQPLQNTSVALSGPHSFSKNTNELGCAVFDYIPVATYDVDVPGKVSWGGEGASSSTASVVAGKTSLKQLEMEPPVKVTAQFVLPDASSGAWHSVSVANSKLPGPASVTLASPVTSIDVTGLFPFLDGYGVYAGTCQRNNPASWQPTYFSTAGKGFASFADGETEKSVLVQLGVLNVNVKNTPSSGTPANMNGALVTVRQRDTQAGCNQDLLMASGNTNASGNVSFALPFGTYRICTSGIPDPARPTITRVRQTSGNSGTTQDPVVRPPSNLTFQSNLQISHGTQQQTPCSTAADTSP